MTRIAASANVRLMSPVGAGSNWKCPGNVVGIISSQLQMRMNMKQGDSERHDEDALRRPSTGAHLVLDGAHDRLEGELQLAGDAGGDLPPQQQPEHDDDEAGQQTETGRRG